MANSATPLYIQQQMEQQFSRIQALHLPANTQPETQSTNPRRVHMLFQHGGHLRKLPENYIIPKVVLFKPVYC
jgi:hypothetical protein